MSKTKNIFHIGSWLLLILINLVGAIPIFQKSGYVPIDPSNVMLVRPGPNQDSSKAASIAINQNQGSASTDKVIVFIHSRYRALQLRLTSIASLLLITMIILTKNRKTNTGIPPQST